jgi:hypothetical protein
MTETPKDVLDYYGTKIPVPVGEAVRRYDRTEGVEQPFSSVVLVVSDGYVLGETRMHVTSIEDCDESVVMVREDGEPPAENVYYLVDDEQVKALTYKLATKTDFVVQHAKDEYLPLSEDEAEVGKSSYNQGSAGSVVSVSGLGMSNFTETD